MSHKSSEFIDILTHGINYKKRRIYFGTPIGVGEEEHNGFNQATVEIAIRAIHEFSELDPKKPIEIHMSTYGGDAYAMLRLMDIILTSPCQIKFFGSGAIMSAGGWILAACDERYLYPETVVMLHDGSERVEGSHTDVKISLKESERLQNRLCEIFARDSIMPVKFWKDVLQRDVYLSATQCFKLGIVDEIMEYKKRGNLRKKRQHNLTRPRDKKEMKKLIADIYKSMGKEDVDKIVLNSPTDEQYDDNIVVEEENLITLTSNESPTITSNK